MTKGIDRYSEKEKRAIRRRNFLARDLGSQKYRQRVIQSKRREDRFIDDFEDTWNENIMYDDDSFMGPMGD